MNDTEFQLTSHQDQVVLGTLLGTSCIVKSGRSAYLDLRQKKGDLRWLKCKSVELASMSRPHPFCYDRDSCHWVSSVNPVWNKYYEKCYKNGKKVVSMDWLDPLRDHGYAVWFLDKGFYDGKQAILRTSRFGKSGTRLIKKYFD